MQVTFLSFWTAILKATADFLLTEPIVYFVGIIFLLCVCQLVKRMI